MSTARSYDGRMSTAGSYDEENHGPHLNTEATGWGNHQQTPVDHTPVDPRWTEAVESGAKHSVHQWGKGANTFWDQGEEKGASLEAARFHRRVKEETHTRRVEKRIKKLHKKIRQCEHLYRKQRGGVSLNADELTKLQKKSEFEKELALLREDQVDSWNRRHTTRTKEALPQPVRFKDEVTLFERVFKKGDLVRVLETFMFNFFEFVCGMVGIINEVDAAGDVTIDFQGEHETKWVFKQYFDKLGYAEGRWSTDGRWIGGRGTGGSVRSQGRLIKSSQAPAKTVPISEWRWVGTGPDDVARSAPRRDYQRGANRSWGSRDPAAAAWEPHARRGADERSKGCVLAPVHSSESTPLVRQASEIAEQAYDACAPGGLTIELPKLPTPSGPTRQVSTGGPDSPMASPTGDDNGSPRMGPLQVATYPTAAPRHVEQQPVEIRQPHSHWTTATADAPLPAPTSLPRADSKDPTPLVFDPHSDESDNDVPRNLRNSDEYYEEEEHDRKVDRADVHSRPTPDMSNTLPRPTAPAERRHTDVVVTYERLTPLAVVVPASPTVKATPKKVEMSGSTVIPEINGEYYLMSEPWCGKPCWRQTNGWLIRWDPPQNNWCVDMTLDKARTKCFSADIEKADVPWPTDVGRWKTWVGTTALGGRNEWREELELTVQSRTLGEKELEAQQKLISCHNIFDELKRAQKADACKQLTLIFGELERRFGYEQAKRKLDTLTRVNGSTNLYQAAQNNQLDFVATLLRLGANINVGWPIMTQAPIWIAASKGHERVVRQLLSDPRCDHNLAGTHAVTKSAYTPYQIAFERGRTSVCEIFEEHEADLAERWVNALLETKLGGIGVPKVELAKWLSRRQLNCLMRNGYKAVCSSLATRSCATSKQTLCF